MRETCHKERFLRPCFSRTTPLRKDGPAICGEVSAPPRTVRRVLVTSRHARLVSSTIFHLVESKDRGSFYKLSFKSVERFLRFVDRCGSSHDPETR